MPYVVLQVNMSMSVRAGIEEAGPFWESGSVISLPGGRRGDITAVSIVIDVPAQ